MLRNLIIGLLFISATAVHAQDTDSLFAMHKGTNLVIKYTVKPGEDMAMLAKRFFISEAALEYANEDASAKKLVPAPGTVVYIPVVRENLYSSKPPFADLHELYYHVAPKDDIGLISTYAGVMKNDMRTLNNLHGNTLAVGQTLHIGWLKMMSLDTSNPANMAAYPAPQKPVGADTVKIPVPGGLDTIYNRQTYNGANVLTEKGTAVFFDKAGRNTIYYAFHSATPRGTIIKIFNPGTGKTIYAKVLDKLPDTKQYANSIIGISSWAKEALGVTDNKAWVEISYEAN